MLVSTALVLMMSIPALALFYGGMVRAKNMLSVLMQVFVTFSLITVLWCIYGYSLAFTEGNAFFGGFDRLFLSGTFDAMKGEFATAAHAEIDALLGQGRRPIVVGGTGLYLRAALAELDLRPPVDPQIRERRRAQLEQLGAPALHDELAIKAPRTAAAIRPQDGQRVTRALELLDAGQNPTPGTDDSRLWTAALRRPTLLAGLTMERQALNARIEARVDAMIAAGAEQEVRAAAAAGASPGARQALGFQQLLDGDVEAMKAQTRRYAKRQMTWMRKLEGVRIFDVTGRGPAEVAGELYAALA